MTQNNHCRQEILWKECYPISFNEQDYEKQSHLEIVLSHSSGPKKGAGKFFY